MSPLRERKGVCIPHFVKREVEGVGDQNRVSAISIDYVFLVNEDEEASKNPVLILHGSSGQGWEYFLIFGLDFFQLIVPIFFIGES